MATLRVPTVLRLLLLAGVAVAGVVLWNVWTAARADAAVDLPLPAPVAKPVEHVTDPLPIPLPVPVIDVPAVPAPPLPVPELELPALPVVLGDAQPPPAAPTAAPPAAPAVPPAGAGSHHQYDRPASPSTTAARPADERPESPRQERRDPPTRPVSDTGSSPLGGAATTIPQLAVLGALAAGTALAVREWIRARRMQFASVTSGRLERPG